MSLRFDQPFLRKWPGQVPQFSPGEAGYLYKVHLEALNFGTSGDKISVLNCPSNVDFEYVYFI